MASSYYHGSLPAPSRYGALQQKEDVLDIYERRWWQGHDGCGTRGAYLSPAILQSGSQHPYRGQTGDGEACDERYMTRLFIPMATVPDTSGPLVSRTWCVRDWSRCSLDNMFSMISTTRLRNPTLSGVLAGLCIGVISHGRDKTSSAHAILARYRSSQPASIRTVSLFATASINGAQWVLQGARAREVVSSDTPSPYNLLQLPKDVVSLLY